MFAVAPPIKSNADGVLSGFDSGAFYSSALLGALKPPNKPKAFGYDGGFKAPGGFNYYEFELFSP